MFLYYSEPGTVSLTVEEESVWLVPTVLELSDCSVREWICILLAGHTMQAFLLSIEFYLTIIATMLPSLSFP